MARLDKHSDEVATRIRFGLLLKRIRDQAGLTQQELAAASLVAQSTISDLELAKKKTRRSIVVRLDRALNANGVLLGAWDTLFAGAGMTTYFREVVDSEQAATKIQEYSLGLVPGLYQVESYVRAISELAEPHANPEAIDQIVGARQKRQELLEREHPPRIIVLLDEVVLLRRFRDPKVMAEQIDHLLKLSYRARTDIQIVPIATEGHAGLGGSFTLMEVPGNGTFAYIESQQTGMALRQPEAVESYERTFAELRSAALPVTVSRSKMEEIRGSIT